MVFHRYVTPCRCRSRYALRLPAAVGASRLVATFSDAYDPVSASAWPRARCQATSPTGASRRCCSKRATAGRPRNRPRQRGRERESESSSLRFQSHHGAIGRWAPQQAILTVTPRLPRYHPVLSQSTLQSTPARCPWHAVTARAAAERRRIDLGPAPPAWWSLVQLTHFNLRIAPLSRTRSAVLLAPSFAGEAVREGADLRDG